MASTIWIRFAPVFLSNRPLNSWTYFGPWSNRPRSCILLLLRRSYQSLGEWSPEVQKEIPRDLWDAHSECSPSELDCKNTRRSWQLCAWSVQQGKLTSTEWEKVSWKLEGVEVKWEKEDATLDIVWSAPAGSHSVQCQWTHKSNMYEVKRCWVINNQSYWLVLCKLSPQVSEKKARVICRM